MLFANRSVENAAAKLNKNAAQIFLEEWITSGKIRPSIGHLLQLLVKSEIFRAADYVAVNILSGKLKHLSGQLEILMRFSFCRLSRSTSPTT